ncbi:solute symporter family protein [Paenibacillus alkalitolerans]|uniref:solute symporter family protein n=1 Tax=Paenibacillus alkalitolerans TaxID=2799335 RepID=UPI0018F695A7|nr:cation acetate symporter [Paenibacillus alkalitolerans]
MNISGFVFFLAIIAGTLFITYSAARRTHTTHQFYAAGNRLTGSQNGLAIAGDYMSAASFLGITGAISLTGFDGFWYSIGFLASYLFVLFFIAEPVHHLGRFTVSDSIAVRFDAKPLRGCIAVNTLIISILYMIAQLVGAGTLLHALLHVDYAAAICIVGALMTVYVVFGGMIAASWVQIIKTILLLAGTLLVSLIVLARFDWSLLQLFDQASQATPLGEKFLLPGNLFEHPLETLSLQLALLLGTAGLPHIAVRFFTVSDAAAVRKSVGVAVSAMGAFYLMTVFLGFGAALLLNREGPLIGGGTENLAVIFLAENLGGEFLMAFVSAVAFATILAVVSGLVVTASSAFAHDIYSHIVRKGHATEKEQMIAAKCSSIGVGVISILLALGAQRLNVAFLASLAFAVAASVNVPVMICTIYWRRFTLAGAITGMATGLLASVCLVLISPNVMHPVTGWIKADPLFPLMNPGLVSIPLGFLGAILGSFFGRPGPEADASYDMTKVQAHTGMRQ